MIVWNDVHESRFRDSMRHTATAALDAILAKLKTNKLVMREDGDVIHELRGSPGDVWQAMLTTLEPKP